MGGTTRLGSRTVKAPSGASAAQRLRLVLGRHADRALGSPLSGHGELGDLEQHLGYLYDRAYSQGRGMRRERSGGLGPSALSVPDWLAHVRDLFPKESLEVVERDAVARFGMTELLEDPEAIERLEPSESTLRLLVQFKSQIPSNAKAQARRVIERIVDDLHRRLATQVLPALTGALDRKRSTRLKSAKNLDARRTVKENLRNWDEQNRRLGIDRLAFFARHRRHASWRVILLVDQSGSMLDSVIHSAILASIFARLPDVDLRFYAFDTHVVDLTPVANDPVEVLFGVQLGGGTLIQRAVAHARAHVAQPNKTLVVIISDFYEGGPAGRLYTEVKALLDAGVKVLGLAALGEGGEPEFDRKVAKALVALGMPVAAMTPKHLAEWVAGHIRGAS